jgi:hypothetical protein
LETMVWKIFAKRKGKFMHKQLSKVKRKFMNLSMMITIVNTKCKHLRVTPVYTNHVWLMSLIL